MIEAVKILAALGVWAAVCRLGLTSIPSKPPDWAVVASFLIFIAGAVWIGAYLAGNARQANVAVKFGAAYWAATIAAGVAVIFILSPY